jgi:hypothetical protein
VRPSSARSRSRRPPSEWGSRRATNPRSRGWGGSPRSRVAFPPRDQPEIEGMGGIPSISGSVSPVLVGATNPRWRGWGGSPRSRVVLHRGSPRRPLRARGRHPKGGDRRPGRAPSAGAAPADSTRPAKPARPPLPRHATGSPGLDPVADAEIASYQRCNTPRASPVCPSITERSAACAPRSDRARPPKAPPAQGRWSARPRAGPRRPRRSPELLLLLARHPELALP